MLDLLLGLFLILVALDVVAWLFVLTVAGTVGLVKRVFHKITFYR